ncbi:serine hydrolase domain-containing protein [Clostridium estertheticum]|uniref:serine hydrolase domain-containing protein n=1 Tax=Clostridium estertheticum TaxID=238834 RepID=UPI001C7DC42A|nr:serine hydrolase domain-containing protein [Clostridium estertheticum]MBX4270048.1 beta-lactamase family protein [Clostridium estertheticum]WLC80252.1 beta-lactamase family protein [Clostridium estertheticum]
MLQEIERLILQYHLNIYSVSEITEKGVKTMSMQPANACNNCYSVAKLFTVTAIGMLQDDGILSVNDKIFNIFREEFPKNYDKKWEKVTIENVIKHQIGFDKGFLDIDVENIYEYGTDDFLHIVLSHQLKFEPGSYRVYSDAAYYLISRIVSAITGMKLDVFLQKRLFTPLQFQEIAWSSCPKGYSMGATGLYIRTEDMVKLGWVYLNNGEYNGKQIVSKNWVKQTLSHGYELIRQGNKNMYAKVGMNGQILYISFDTKRAIAWHGYDETNNISILFDLLQKS